MLYAVASADLCVPDAVASAVCCLPDAVASAVCRLPDAVACTVCRVPCAGCCSCSMYRVPYAGDGVPFVDGVLLVASGDVAS